MPAAPDVHIHYDGSWWSGPMWFSLYFVAVGPFLFLSLGPEAAPGLLFSVCGILLGLYCRKRLHDKSVKLSLVAEGIRDHRKGRCIPWADVRGVRVFIETMEGSPTSATMYVAVPKGKRLREIAIDVDCLEFSPEKIAQLVLQRANSAIPPVEAEPTGRDQRVYEPQPAPDKREDESSGSDDRIAAVLEPIRGDLKAGLPVSFVRSKLIKCGLDVVIASVLVRMACEGQVARCNQCQLDYHTTKNGCSACGSPLSLVFLIG